MRAADGCRPNPNPGQPRILLQQPVDLILERLELRGPLEAAASAARPAREVTGFNTVAVICSWERWRHWSAGKR